MSGKLLVRTGRNRPSAVSPPPPPPPGQDGPVTCAQAGTVLLCQDFDQRAVGDWDLAELKADFPGTDGFIAGVTNAPSGTQPGRGTIVGGGSALSGNSYRSTILLNTVGSDNGCLFHPPISGLGPALNLEEAYLGYWVRFDANFPDIKGGKLPGLAGGVTDDGQANPCCGRSMLLGRGFSSRLMFIRQDFVCYFYWIDNPTPISSNGKKYGGPRGAIAPWNRDQWYFIEERVKLNTPGLFNGLFQVWVDGVMRANLLNQRIRASGQNWFIDGVIFHNYLGGSDSTWWSPITTFCYFDSIVVSRTRIGFI